MVRRRVRAVRSGFVAAIVVVTLTAAAGCGSRAGGATPGGDKIDFCTGLAWIDFFREPRPDDRTEVLEYATNFVKVIDRVDVRRPLQARDELTVGDKKVFVAAEAMANLRVMRRSIVRLRTAAREAPGDGRVVRDATNALAEDAAYAQAELAATNYFRDTCKAGL